FSTQRRRDAEISAEKKTVSVLSAFGLGRPLYMRRTFFWKLKQREIPLGERTAVMAVLNVTPDSFSDGGRYTDPDRAFARAVEMEEQGGDIIDIGAESTRPGASPISASEELRRLVPVLKRL